MSAFSPRFTITDPIARDLTIIERARGFLEAAKLSEQWLRQMSERALLLEAHHTTHIEGTHLTLEQAGQIWEGRRVQGADPEDVRELLNYRDAFEMVSDYLQSAAPLTEGVIREIHKRLVLNVRGQSAAPGEYRRVQNYVAHGPTRQIIYTPPPPQDVAPMMAELVAWLSQPGTVHPILVAGIAQFQLVHIHPFVDGNGRTSRLLSTLLLYRAGYDFKRLFTISEFYDRDRSAFYRAIQSVRESDMNLTGWLEFFTNGLATQLTEVKSRGQAVIRADVLGKTHNLNDRQASILRHIMLSGPLGVADLEELFHGANSRTLRRDLKLLLDKKIIADSGTNPTDPNRKYRFEHE